MYRYGGELRLKKFDQDNMKKLVDEWKSENPDDEFFFRGYGEILDKSEAEKVRKMEEIVEDIKSSDFIHKVDLKGGLYETNLF